MLRLTRTIALVNEPIRVNADTVSYSPAGPEDGWVGLVFGFSFLYLGF